MATSTTTTRAVPNAERQQRPATATRTVHATPPTSMHITRNPDPATLAAPALSRSFETPPAPITTACVPAKRAPPRSLLTPLAGNKAYRISTVMAATWVATTIQIFTRTSPTTRAATSLLLLPHASIEVSCNSRRPLINQTLSPLRWRRRFRNNSLALVPSCSIWATRRHRNHLQWASAAK